MNIGVIGLGKLGFPCAVAMAAKGHDVMGYDLDPGLMSRNPRRYRETGSDGVSDFNLSLPQSSIRFGSLASVVAHGDIVFVAVQTPHGKEFEGVTPLSERRADFDYQFLIRAVEDVSRVARRETVLAVISTVLPGTIRRCVMPLVAPQIKVVYNPYFISMGTAMRDFLHPEFVLCGADDAALAERVAAFYRTITPAPFYATSVENAELIKVTYNTYISMKIAFANTIMEMCHKIPGSDVDSVTNALKLATRRIINAKYLGGGMGDGGACHPRDNIAMSWLARRLDLSFDWFENVMVAREKQTEWLADLMTAYDLPKAILGYSFKSESNIVTGSAALLLKEMLERRGHPVFLYDPWVDSEPVSIDKLAPMVFLIGANHDVFSTYRFPSGSVVIDPWRYLARVQPDVQLISVGRMPAERAVTGVANEMAVRWAAASPVAADSAV